MDEKAKKAYRNLLYDYVLSLEEVKATKLFKDLIQAEIDAFLTHDALEIIAESDEAFKRRLLSLDEQVLREQIILMKQEILEHRPFTVRKEYDDYKDEEYIEDDGGLGMFLNKVDAFLHKLESHHYFTDAKEILEALNAIKINIANTWDDEEEESELSDILYELDTTLKRSYLYDIQTNYLLSLANPIGELAKYLVEVEKQGLRYSLNMELAYSRLHVKEEEKGECVLALINTIETIDSNHSYFVLFNSLSKERDDYSRVLTKVLTLSDKALSNSLLLLNSQLDEVILEFIDKADKRLSTFDNYQMFLEKAVTSSRNLERDDLLLSYSKKLYALSFTLEPLITIKAIGKEEDIREILPLLKRKANSYWDSALMEHEKDILLGKIGKSQLDAFKKAPPLGYSHNQSELVLTLPKYLVTNQKKEEPCHKEFEKRILSSLERVGERTAKRYLANLDKAAIDENEVYSYIDTISVNRIKAIVFGKHRGSYYKAAILLHDLENIERETGLKGSNRVELYLSLKRYSAFMREYRGWA